MPPHILLKRTIMENLKKLNDEVSIAGQPSVDDLREMTGQGFRTVVNLRMPDEPGVDDEERIVEGQGLNYAAIPVSPDTLDDAAVERFIATIASEGRAPVLVHCKSGGRAGMMTLLHMAVQHGWSLQQTLDEGQKLGIAPSETSPYRTFFEGFIKRHSPAER
jgi:uncharacterized protein (TIGR01244 family)